MRQIGVVQGRLSGFWEAVVLPLVRQVWVLALVATFGILAVMAWSRLQVPQYRATSLMQAEAGAKAADLREGLLGRQALTALAMRHGLAEGATDEAALARLIRVLVIKDVPGGLEVSVLWPDPEVAARLANDLAQQILDRSGAGLEPGLLRDLGFYRREEARLWQEIAALTAEVESLAAGGTTGGQPEAAGRRVLALLQDQYDVVRGRLAESEVEARRQEAAGSGRFSLLQRATAVEARPIGQGWMLTGVGGSMLLAVAAAFVLERRFPMPSRPHYAASLDRPGRLQRLYRLFDDPGRPILGLPRFLVISLLIVSWLVVLALFLGRP